MEKRFPTLGCCGLDCGLCPRYYTKGSSRCPGCFGGDFAEKHPSCSIITCCFKGKGLEVCGECPEYPCMKFGKETYLKDSFISHKRILTNNAFISEHGLEMFLFQQKQRIEFLETFLGRFDEGRSKSFYCLAVSLLSLDSLGKAFKKAEKELKKNQIAFDDFKVRSEVLKRFLKECAREEKEELELRK